MDGSLQNYQRLMKTVRCFETQGCSPRGPPEKKSDFENQ